VRALRRYLIANALEQVGKDSLEPTRRRRSVYVVSPTDLIDAAAFNNVQTQQSTILVSHASNRVSQSAAEWQIKLGAGQCRFSIEHLLDEVFP
jgi:hypothetical protein